jgi:hypothetical protein
MCDGIRTWIVADEEWFFWLHSVIAIRVGTLRAPRNKAPFGKVWNRFCSVYVFALEARHNNLQT